MSVHFIIVSHSAKLADGVVELAQQMAPNVTFHAIGGTADGKVGTSFDRVLGAVEDVLDAEGDAVLLTDLGSATMTAEAVLDFITETGHVAVAEGPLVEGAVAGAVAASTGASLREVVKAVAHAATSLVPVPAPRTPARGIPTRPGTTPPRGVPAMTPPRGVASLTPPRGVPSVTPPRGVPTRTGTLPTGLPIQPTPTPAEPEGPECRAELRLCNEVGLHARPAAQLSRLAASFDAEVYVNGSAASSVLTLMSLGLGQGDSMEVVAVGPQADAAIAAITELVESNFGEEH